MQQVFRHNLGDRVRDRITGQVGIVTSRSEHLFGCARYWIEPQDLKDGKPIDGRWLDEDCIDVVEASVIKPRFVRVMAADAVSSAPLERTGGPSNQPSSSTRASEQ